MPNIIYHDFRRKVPQTNLYDGSAARQLSTNLIRPATQVVEKELAEERASEPIKSIEDINRITKYLVEHKRYRDNMLFILGINFGLRVSDLILLRFCDIIDENRTFKQTFPVLEKKTKNTRSVKKNRYITVNEAVMDAVTLYLKNHPANLDDFIFRPEGNRHSKEGNLSRKSVDRIIKEIAQEVGLTCKVATHTLRKTFGYHQMMMSNNDPRKLLLLQKIFGHSTAAQTLDYIGITQEEVTDAYLGLNLGGKNCYAGFSTVAESDVAETGTGV